jgi:hypothetical protein
VLELAAAVTPLAPLVPVPAVEPAEPVEALEPLAAPPEAPDAPAAAVVRWLPEAPVAVVYPGALAHPAIAVSVSAARLEQRVGLVTPPG